MIHSQYKHVSILNKNVLTLNYYEFWEVKNICKFLHGEIDLKTIICNEKQILFYSKERYSGLVEYKDKINELKNQLIMLANEY